MSTYTNKIMGRMSKQPVESNTKTYIVEGRRIYPVILDLDKVEPVSTQIKFKQYDYGTSFIDVQLVESDKVLALTGKIIVGIFKDSKGDLFVDDSNRPIRINARTLVSEDGIINLPIPKDVLKNFGTVECEIMIFDSNGSRSTSPLFSFNIEKSIFDHEINTSPAADPICGEVLCGEAICGGENLLESEIEVSSFLSDDFLERFK